MSSISRMMKFQENSKYSQLTDREKLINRKTINDYWRDSRKKSKLTKCLFCGTTCSSFCNSHTIPAFALRNISSDGEVLNANTLINNPYKKKSDGIKKSGTFQLICRSCDSNIFMDYESPENYASKPNGKMITQIAMKNYLRYIYKRNVEIELYKTLIKGDLHNSALERQLYISILDLQSYQKGFERAKKFLKKNDNDKYYMFYHKKLNYVVPYAFQSFLCLVTDLDGKLINDIYYLSPSYEIQSLHVAVLPLEDSTEIILFIEKNSNKYRKFYKQFLKLDEEDQLSLINYMIFNYSEEIFMSKNLKDDVLENPELVEIAKISNMIEVLDINDRPYDVAKDSFNLSYRNKIPNLLSLEYALKSVNTFP